MKIIEILATRGLQKIVEGTQQLGHNTYIRTDT